MYFYFQSVIHKAGFRSLDDGEECEFESIPSDKGVEATYVCGPSGAECKGSNRRPMSRKKFRKIRYVSIQVIGPAQESLVQIASASSEGSDESAQMRSLVRAFPSRIHKAWK